MIIRRLFNSGTSLKYVAKPSFFQPSLFSFSQNTPTQIDNRKQLLSKVLKDVNMLKQPSIFMQETQELEARKKRSLTKQDKLKLGLYVPKMSINPRMNIESQLSYRQKVCQSLYEMQKTHLDTKVRILQKMTESQVFTMDKYINTVYKDIYARYLINKGIGVEWKGQYSSYGVLNSSKLSTSPFSIITDFIRANLENIEKIESIAPYSYLTKNFIPSDLIEVENIRKIGYYVRLPLTQFGKHYQNFNKLKERGGKVQILVFCEFLEKLINPHGLCLMPGQKMIIMKKLFVQKSNKRFSPSQAKQQQTGLRYDYLITSLDIYNKQKQFFTEKNYEKHLFFESDHLVGMKAEYNVNLNDAENKISLAIMSEIQGYERNPGLYIVNGSTTIPDYERVQQFKENGGEISTKFKNILESNGNLNLFDAQTSQQTNIEQKLFKQSQSLSIIDIQFEQKLLEILKKHLEFLELYDVFEDQVYSNKQTNQVLRFRLFDKFQISIKDSAYQTLQDHFQTRKHQVVLHESKVKLPEFKKFKKPRQRRQHKKEVRQSLKQRTDYMSLLDSIKSISNIPISSSVEGDLRIYFEKNQEGNIVNAYENADQIKIQDKSKIQEVIISTDLISAISFLYNTEYSHDLNSIIIEPQTFTQEILPLCLHLTLYKTKEQPQKRGRKTSKSQISQTRKVLDSLKMIYLHPTMKPAQRQIEVQSFITGSMKISNKHEYGFGFEAIRLWVCKHSQYLGDRQLKEKDVNEELKNSAFIRKLYAELIPFVPKSQLSESLNQVSFDQLNLLDRFMHEQIDAYILNMEHFYSRLMLKEAYEYTMDFYKNVVEEIFVKTVRHHIITYPNEKDNLSHGITVKRILKLLSVIAPLFPFSSFHISKTQIMKWPSVDHKETFYKNLLEYNALIKIRTELRNKLSLNNFSHSEVVFPVSDVISYTQQDLKKFLGVDKISFVEPDVKEKKFGFQLRFNETMGGKSKIFVFESKDHCIRCDPNSKIKDHLCYTCTQYLEQNVGKEVEYYDKRNNSLLISNSSSKEQIHNQQGP